MADRVEPRFQVGDRVRVRDYAHPGHVRTPHYIRGKTGRIAALHGAFPNPEALAYGRPGLPRQPLYLVSFDQTEVWPNYPHSGRDTVQVDIYQHWLDPA